MSLTNLSKVTTSGIATGTSLLISNVNSSGVVTASTVQVGSATTIHTTGIDLGSGNINSHNINSTGIITATGGFVGNVSGTAVTATTASFTNATISGDLTVQGSTTTLDTILTEVDKLEVGANNTTVGVAITQSGTGDILRLYDDASSVFSVADGGTVTASGDISIADKIIHTGDTNTAIRFPADDTVTVETGGSERVRVTSDGKVGIGLTNPSDDLTIKNVHTLGLGGNAIKFYRDAGNYFILEGDSGAFFQFRHGSTDLVRITSTGRVGIGTVNPSAPLHIANGTATVRIQDSTSAQPTSVAKVDFYYNNGSLGFVGYNGDETGSLELWNTYSGSVILGTGNTERLRITSSGNVGINSSSPNSKLDVNRGSVTGLSDGTVTDIITISETGSQGNTGQRILFKNVQQNWEQGAITALREGVANSFSLVFSSSNNGTNTERLRITSSGDVGIGVTGTIGYKLEVNGSFAATTKSFLIQHPTKENYKLRHGSLEGPENGVYVRGRTSTNIIELPDYWTGLVDANSITVNLTPIGNRHIWVEEINNNKVYINSEDTIDCFYTVFAERKDVEKLIVEIEEN